jgi:hypothetical protein
MKPIIDLTPESLNAIKQRQQQAAWSKSCAEQRFMREQEALKAKKSKNRSLLATALFCIGLTSVAFSMGNGPSTGAKPGPILAKSELSSNQLKKLNVMPLTAEKPKAK